MISFVTWPPFCTIIIYVKGGQVTKLIMHGCEIPCKHVFEVKGFKTGLHIYNRKAIIIGTSPRASLSEPHINGVSSRNYCILMVRRRYIRNSNCKWLDKQLYMLTQNICI